MPVQLRSNGGYSASDGTVRTHVSTAFAPMSRYYARWHSWFLVSVVIAVFAPSAWAQQSDQELAKKLSNPIASLISLPVQMNFDTNIGPDDKGDRFVMNVQPVIPIALSDDWNVISRTILPITYQDEIAPGTGEQFGVGDVVQSIFLSPQKPTLGIIWGAGPVILVPSATDKLLGAEKFGIGPTAVALKQQGPWTYGMLANHIWSVAGDDSRRDVNSTFLQPFVSYTTPTAWTFSVNTEATYDWVGNEWAVPVNGQVSKLLKIGGQPVSIGAGLRYWADSAPAGPEGLGARFVITLLFPK